MTSARRWALGLLCLGAPAAGCTGASDAPAATALSPAAQASADALGRELFELVDRAADYRGSHAGVTARSLRQLGLDSLTRSTARHLTTPGGVPTFTVAYRRPAGEPVASCEATDDILEEAALQDGLFTVRCTLPDGEARDLRVGPGPR